MMVSIVGEVGCAQRDVGGGQAVLDVAGLAGADDGDVHGGVGQCPGDGQLADGDAAVGGELLQRVHGGQVASVALADEHRAGGAPVVGGEGGVLGHGAGEQAVGQRSVDQHADVVLRGCRAAPGPRCRGGTGDRAAAASPPAGSRRTRPSVRRRSWTPRRGRSCPRRPARPGRPRSRRPGPSGRASAPGRGRCARPPARVRLASTPARSHRGLASRTTPSSVLRSPPLVAITSWSRWLGQLAAQRRAQQPLGRAEPVGLRGVEEVDPQLAGPADRGHGGGLVEPAPVPAQLPGAERDARHRQPGAAQCRGLHIAPNLVRHRRPRLFDAALGEVVACQNGGSVSRCRYRCCPSMRPASGNPRLPASR